MRGVCPFLPFAVVTAAILRQSSAPSEALRHVAKPRPNVPAPDEASGMSGLGDALPGVSPVGC